MTRHEPFVSMVRSGMRRRGLTLRSFCRAVLLDPSFFSKVLSGKRSPPSEEAVLRRIALVLGIPAPELIVAAGRIPSEWGRLVRNPALFGDVHRLASATLRTGEGQRVRQPAVWAEAGPAEAGASPASVVRKDLATELL